MNCLLNLTNFLKKVNLEENRIKKFLYVAMAPNNVKKSPSLLE